MNKAAQKTQITAADLGITLDLRSDFLRVEYTEGRKLCKGNKVSICPRKNWQISFPGSFRRRSCR